MSAAPLIITLLFAGMAVLLWRLPGRDEYETRKSRHLAQAIGVLVVMFLLPLTLFVSWRSTVAARDLAAMGMEYPGARTQWVPTEADALNLLALQQLAAGGVAAADSLRRAGVAAEGSGDRYWYAITHDSPAEVIAYYEPLLSEAGWTLAERSSIHLLGVRGEEWFMISATEGWTHTDISFAWYPRGVRR